ncbi:AAA family ATPase, partial [Vibrio pectenicida]
EDAAAELGEESEPEAPVEPQEEVAELDDADLPEFTEEDAAAELGEESEPEVPEGVPSSSMGQDKVTLDLSDLDIPKYGETSVDPVAIEEALPVDTDDDDLTTIDKPEPEPEPEPEPDNSDEDFNLDELDLPALSEIPSEADQNLANHEYNEAAFEELLSEDEAKSTGSFDFESPDAITSDSAGLNIEAMLEVGGEDWNGFSLSSDQQAEITDDIPVDQQAAWDQSNRPDQAQVLDEDWEDQEQIEDFTPDEGEFKTIDELMAEVENEEEAGSQEEELQLEVGLSDFPDVIGDTGNVDVDDNSEAAGKLDLAKIYIEMNDSEGAIKLLEEAIVDGGDEIRREAKNLIDLINNKKSD